MISQKGTAMPAKTAPKEKSVYSRTDTANFGLRH
jgi:hypothetical protein